MELFGRKVRLHVENLEGTGASQGVTIEDLNVEYTIERNVRLEPNVMRALVFNLSEETRSKLEKPTPMVATLSAGYGEPHDLFVGDIRSVRHRRAGPNLITEIEAGDGELEANVWARRSFPVGTGIDNVFTYLVNKISAGQRREIALGRGNIGNAVGIYESNGIPTTLKHGLHVRGYAVDELHKLCDSRGVELSIQNRKVQVLEYGKGLDEGTVPKVTPTSGLVGAPTIDNDGILSANLRLIPNVFPGSLIDVESDFIKGGRFKVLRTLYTGSLYGSEFNIEIEAQQQ